MHSVQSFHSKQQQQQHRQSRTFTIQQCLLNEAKHLHDPYFEYLWRNQASIVSFVKTAGGRTTCLRPFSEQSS